MSNATYINYSHYIQEGWARKPKEFFIHLLKLMKEDKLGDSSKLLDIGCATGELVNFLSYNFTGLDYTGVDVFDDLILEAKKKLPGHEFINSSVLALPDSMSNKFDCVTAMGVMSIFDIAELTLFWDNLMRVTKPNGVIYVLSPLNEYKVDSQIRHRKVATKNPRWETGWNIYSFETICDILAKHQCTPVFEKFQIQQSLSQKQDPIRTWTISTEKNDKQLINGLKLMIDHYFIKVIKK